MAVTFAVGLRACCVAVGLLMLTVRGAEPVSPLIGLTRDQLLQRIGEPKSQIDAGARVIYFYPRERIVLRDNVVVEVDSLSPDAPPPPSPSETSAPGTRAATSPTQGPAPESRVEIKSVRPPSTKDGRTTASEPPRETVPTQAPPPPTVSPRNFPPAEIIVSEPPKTEAPSAPSALNNEKATSAKADKAAEKKASDDLAAKKKQDAAAAAARRRAEQAAAPAATEEVIGVRTYVIALVVLVGGIGVLFWRYRQRQLELAASSVENTPVITPTTHVFSGNAFSADVLARLEWRRFEELVAAYYNKTGVIAVRTKAGPASPVHIKISWKGEARPFAYVQCIAQPGAPIDQKPLQALVAALAADDIRRGYVVTAGKFNMAARDFADQKHLTLLPGDLLIEKLNALPVSARTEIGQAVSAGDYTVPSCPKCDAKMLQSNETPPVWRCPTHPEQTIPVRNQ